MQVWAEVSMRKAIIIDSIIKELSGVCPTKIGGTLDRFSIKSFDIRTKLLMFAMGFDSSVVFEKEYDVDGYINAVRIFDNLHDMGVIDCDGHSCQAEMNQYLFGQDCKPKINVTKENKYMGTLTMSDLRTYKEKCDQANKLLMEISNDVDYSSMISKAAYLFRFCPVNTNYEQKVVQDATILIMDFLVQRFINENPLVIDNVEELFDVDSTPHEKFHVLRKMFQTPITDPIHNSTRVEDEESHFDDE